MSEQETKLTKITMEFVEEQTDTRSLLRGEDYYKRNAVREIIFNKETDRVSASVRGAMQYTVTINAVSVSPEFSCTCPVGYRYMCKHGVAVALTILNNPGFIQLSDDEKVTKKIPALPLKKVFQQATPSAKIGKGAGQFGPLKDIWKRVSQMLTGHYSYYGVSGNSTKIKQFHYLVERLHFKWLNWRSQKRSCNWEQFSMYEERFPLPKPKIYHIFY